MYTKLMKNVGLQNQTYKALKMFASVFNDSKEQKECNCTKHTNDSKAADFLSCGAGNFFHFPAAVLKSFKTTATPTKWTYSI